MKQSGGYREFSFRLKKRSADLWTRLWAMRKEAVPWLMPHLMRIIVAGMTIMAMTGCTRGVEKTGTDADPAIVVEDFRGQKLTFSQPVQRIVCLMESALSGLYMLEAGAQIAGVPRSVYVGDVAPQYAILDERIREKTLPAPGNWDFVSLENVVALNPGLVIMWASQVESIQAIEAKGIPVYAVMIKSLADVYKEIEDFGKLTGREARADMILRLTRTTLSEIESATKETTPGGEKKQIYFMWAQGPLETSGRKSMVNELMELAGVENVIKMDDEHLVVNLERLVEWDPDVIVMWYNPARDPEDIMNLPGWSRLSAVKNRQVYELPSTFFCDLWTLKFQYAVKLLASWCGTVPPVQTSGSEKITNFTSEREKENFLKFDPEKEKEAILMHLYGSRIHQP